MQEDDDTMDGMLTQHAIFKIMDSKIIPCFCGAYRKIVQNKNTNSLVTECLKCKIKEPFNIADLTIIGGALLKLCFGDGTELKLPNVTNEEVYDMIEDIQNHEVWVKEIEGQMLRAKLKIVKGGLST